MHSLEDLKNKFATNKSEFLDFCLIESPLDNSVYFVHVIFDGTPKFIASVKVFVDLSYEVYYAEQTVQRDKYSTSKSIFFLSDFLNLLKA